MMHLIILGIVDLCNV